MASPKDLFLQYFSFLYMLTTYQMHLSISGPVMFTDDTNLLFNDKDMKHLFTVVKKELVNIKDWFTSNKLSLNVEKTKYSFLHKPSKKGDIPFRLPKLVINNYETQREKPINFLGIFLTWKELIKLSKNKIAKNISILYKARGIAMPLLLIYSLLPKPYKYSLVQH